MLKEGKAELLTASKIGKEIGLESRDVNSILVDINYIDRLGHGYRVVNKKHGVQKKVKDTPYVAWKHSLLKDEVFLREVSLKKDFHEDEQKELKVDNTDENQAPKEPKKFDRMAYGIPQYRASNGMYLRSKSETILCNWCYDNYISISYEKRLPIKEEVYTDFYLNQYKIYIEVWGLNDENYLRRKAQKIKLYEENGFNLISLTEDDIKNIDDVMPLKLLEFGFKLF